MIVIDIFWNVIGWCLIGILSIVYCFLADLLVKGPKTFYQENKDILNLTKEQSRNLTVGFFVLTVLGPISWAIVFVVQIKSVSIWLIEKLKTNHEEE